MTPDTSAYFHAAYLLIGVIYVVYHISLWRRSRATMDRLRRLVSTSQESRGA